MTIRKIELYVEPLHVADLLLDLSQIDGIQVSLPTKVLPSPNVNKEHSAYSIGFAELSAIIISISGTATASVSLATAILQYKAAKSSATELVDKSVSAKPVININNTIIYIDDFSDSQRLAEQIQKVIEEEPARRQPPSTTD
ncbi:MAG: hypothetical protein ACPGVO_20935 [Spirulinaceae cyanobacterium]